MLKKIIKTHTAKLDFCLYYRTYFFYETLSFTNRERRVIASNRKKKANIPNLSPWGKMAPIPESPF